MSQNLIPDRIRKLVCDTLRIDSARYSDDLEVGSIPEWDSLGQVNLPQAAEAEFGITLDIRDALNIQSVAELAETLQRYTDDAPTV